jgi:hypothetical protein
MFNMIIFNKFTLFSNIYKFLLLKKKSIHFNIYIIAILINLFK